MASVWQWLASVSPPKSPFGTGLFRGVFGHFPNAADRSRLRGCGLGFPRGRIRCASPRADGTGFPTVEASPTPLLPTRCFLLGEWNTSERPPFFNEACSSKRRSTSPPLFPENLRPSTRHRGHMLPSILTSTKQRISKTAKRGVSKTRRQHNRKTAQQRVCKTAQQENKRAMNSRRQDFSTSVRTEVRHSDAFPRLQHPTGLFILTDFVPDAGFGNGRFASSDWPANKRERDMIFDPFFWGGSETLYVLPPASCVFSYAK